MTSDAILSATFSALADPTRREILRQLRLQDCELSVGELVEPLEISWPAVTRHLKVLEAAGLLRRRRDGRRHLVRLNAGALREADHWLGFYRLLWEGASTIMAVPSR